MKTQRIVRTWVLAAVVLAGALAASAQTALRPTEFGGVYFPGEPIALDLSIPSDALPGELTATVRDAEDKQVHSGALRPQWQAAESGPSTARLEIFSGQANPGLGYYVVRLEGAGEPIETAVVVVPPPREDVNPETSPMGMVVAPGEQFPGELDGYLRAARRMGSRWISIDVPMSTYAPEPGVLKFDAPAAGRGINLDPIVAMAQREGLLINQKLFGVPAWLASVVSDETRSPWYRDCYTSPIQDQQAYEQVVAALAERYRGTIRSYEFGNSPFREPRYYCGTNEDFLRDLQWTHHGVKAGDPTALVCAAGFVQPTDLVNDLLEKAPDTIDVLTVHYITARPQEVATPSHYQAIFEEVGFRKPMWDTSAIGIPPDDLGLKRGATVIANTIGAFDQGCIRSLVRNLSYGVTRTMFSALNIPNHHNIFTADEQPRSMVCEFAVAANQIDGAEYLGPWTPSQEVMEGYWFRRGDDTFLVAWANTNGSGAMLELPAAGQSCTVVDRFGREKSVAAQDGALKLPVGFRPLFIHGLQRP